MKAGAAIQMALIDKYSRIMNEKLIRGNKPTINRVTTSYFIITILVIRNKL